MKRRVFMHTAAATAIGSLAAGSALAQQDADPSGTTPPPRNWNNPASVAYPDPAVEVFDARFKKYVEPLNNVERLWTGAIWTEGPVYFGDMHCLLFSDVPNSRIMRYDEVTNETTLFRYPSNKANGNTRDNQGRLVTCEQGARRLTRTEHNGAITILAASYQRKQLNSPNGVVVKSDDTVWFTDPTYGIGDDLQGHMAKAELPRNVYMFDPRRNTLRVAVGDFN